jgi:UDP-N-acetylglucosamine--N-acetylmuramyl-(pentapeptide) pyrophosphoryl-undecaprenol N-acetylglucosamine transferase
MTTENESYKIVFTGGGSAGHVTPNIAIIQRLKKAYPHWEINYIGSQKGLEKKLLSHLQIPYYTIATGKFRRYFSWQNFIDPFQIFYGILQATLIIKRLKPKIIFSKGGFVSFPVVIGGWLNKIPVIIHESDRTPGLANRLGFPFAFKIFLTSEETTKFLKQKAKALITGTPIRDELFNGNSQKGRVLCNFQENKKIILVIGGGLGASKINKTINNTLPLLLPHYQVAHICGPNKTTSEGANYNGYKQFTYLDEEFCDVLTAADIIISRSGANSLYEFLALKKPHILIPMPTSQSRGEQISNARYTKELGLSFVLEEKDLTPESLHAAIIHLDENISIYQERLEKFSYQNGTDIIVKFLEEFTREK